MRKLLMLVGFVLLFLAGGYLFIKNVGNLRPLLPVLTTTDIVKTIEQRATGEIERENLTLPIDVRTDPRVTIFAKDLGGVRDLAFSPDETLVASVPTQGQIIALPDRNQDGVADRQKIIIASLGRPHGITFLEDKLYVAEETKVQRFIWDPVDPEALPEKFLFDLPKGGRHWTRAIEFDELGRMYVSIGSTCDVCFEENPWHGAIIVSDKDGRDPKLFAEGLRNSVFIKLNPETGELWGTEMGRDFLGDDLPPDEINIIKGPSASSGQNSVPNFGWPVCYGDRDYDFQFAQRQASYCDLTEAPAFKIQAHSAPLGLAFRGGYLYVAYHGSWNRSVPTGYKVVRMKVDGNNVGSQEDFLIGFLQGDTALGRPVDLEFDKNGDLFVSDDKAGVIYKVDL